MQGYLPAVSKSQEKCSGCALCAEMCPDVAIIVFK
jgi:2-oxoglutarate ferredoxin oxidoreductase subunit delta